MTEENQSGVSQSGVSQADVITALHEEAIEGSPTPIIYANYPAQEIIYINEAALKLLKYSRGDLMGEDIAVLVPPEEMSKPGESISVSECTKRHRRAVESFMQGRQSRQFGYERKLNARTGGNGRTPVALKVSSFIYAGKSYICEEIRDREQDIEQQETILSQAEELRTLNRDLEVSLRESEAARIKSEQSARKNEFQKIIISRVMGLSGVLYFTPYALVFLGIRVPDTMQSLSRDATMLLLSTLGGAIAGILGYEIKNKMDKASATQQKSP